MTEEQATTAVVRGLYPTADWQDEHFAYVPCPGINEHTTDNGRRDCRITINDGLPPTIFCCHQSCKAVVEDANKQMRSAIGKLKTALPTGNHIRRGLAKAVNLPTSKPPQNQN